MVRLDFLAPHLYKINLSAKYRMKKKRSYEKPLQ